MKLTRFLSPILSLLVCANAVVVGAVQDKKAQEKQASDDLIKISAELVQVDVLVTDKNNKPVSGLKQEDFDLLDNDKHQKISFFSYEESRSGKFEDNDQSRTLPRVITPGELKRVVAFVVDTLHIRQDNLYRTKKMLRDFIDTKMEPGDLVLIMASGGGSGLYSQFTADQRLLHSAVAQLRQAFILDDVAPARRSSSTSQAVISLLPALAEARPGITQAPGQGGTQGSGIDTGDQLEESDVRTSLSALNGTIAAMKRFPGRKIGVFISEGIRTFRTQAESILADTTYEAARANVVFYAIDPSGLDPVGFGAQEGGVSMKGPLTPDPNSPTGFAETSSSVIARGDAGLGARRSDFFESQDALARLANETGGRFYRNNNDIKLGLNKLLDENAAYYLLGFQPESGRWDGKFHKLHVSVKGHPELTVTTRKGYLARSEKQPAHQPVNAKAAEMLEAISSPLVRRDIDVRVTPFYKEDAKREGFVTTLVHIDASRLNFKEVSGSHKDKLVVNGLVMGGSGRPIDSFSNTIDLSFSTRDFDAVRKAGILITRAANLRPGGYQVRILVREVDSGLLGTATSYLEIPDTKSDQLATSSIFTDLQLLQQTKTGDTAGAATSASMLRFQRNAQLPYVVIVYNAKPGEKSGPPQLEMTTRIYRAGQPVFSGKPKPVEMIEGSAPPSRIITGGVLQLASLAPDDYTLEVTIVDKNRKDARVRQELTFTVE